MTDHPTTFRGEPADQDSIGWDDSASIHRSDDGGGVLDAMKGLYRGSLGQMVAMIRNMPEAERGQFVIQKAGDRRIESAEIMALAKRKDFPG